MNKVSVSLREPELIKEIYKNSSQEPGKTPKNRSQEPGARQEQELVKEISKNGSQELGARAISILIYLY